MSTFMPELNKSTVIALAEFYDYMNKDENSVEQYILKKATTIEDTDQLFHLIVDDENSILKWKGALRIKRYFQDVEYWTDSKKSSLYDTVSQLSKNPLNNKNVVSQLANYKGISFPLASTIAFFMSQQNCPIIDVRAVDTLKKYGYGIVDNYDWNNYFDMCDNLKTEFDVSFRQLDKALWIYHDVNNYVEKYKGLQKLGLVNKL